MHCWGLFLTSPDLASRFPRRRCLDGVGQERSQGFHSLSPGMALRSRRFRLTRAPERSGVAFVDGGDRLGPGVGMETEK